MKKDNSGFSLVTEYKFLWVGLISFLIIVPVVEGLNHAVSGVIIEKGYIGGWIYPAILAWLIPVVGFNC